MISEVTLFVIAYLLIWSSWGRLLNYQVITSLGLKTHVEAIGLPLHADQQVISDNLYIMVICHVVFFKMHSYLLTNLEYRQ